MDRTFTAGKSAAEYNNLIGHFLFFFIIIIDDHDVLSVQSRNRRNKRSASSCDDQCICIFFFSVFLCDFCGSTDLHTGIACKEFVGSSQFIHLMFERKCLLTLEDTADFIFFLTEDDLMASSCCGIGCIKSSRAAACNEYFFLDRCRMDFVTFHLTSDQWIDGTASCGCRGSLCHTGEAAETFHNLFVPVFHDFAWKERVCEKCTRHVNDICFSLGNDLFHLCRVI